MEETRIRNGLWTIIILANCENNSFLYIEEIYNEISQHVLYNIKSLFSADRYDFIYKSHGGNTTNISSKYIKSLLLKCTDSEFNAINLFIEKKYRW